MRSKLTRDEAIVWIATRSPNRVQQAYEKSLEEIQSPEDEPLPPMGRLPRKRRDPLLHLAMGLALESTFAKHEPPKDASDITAAIVNATRKLDAAISNGGLTLDHDNLVKASALRKLFPSPRGQGRGRGPAASHKADHMRHLIAWLLFGEPVSRGDLFREIVDSENMPDRAFQRLLAAGFPAALKEIDMQEEQKMLTRIEAEIARENVECWRAGVKRGRPTK